MIARQPSNVSPRWDPVRGDNQQLHRNAATFVPAKRIWERHDNTPLTQYTAPQKYRYCGYMRHNTKKEGDQRGESICLSPCCPWGRSRRRRCSCPWTTPGSHRIRPGPLPWSPARRTQPEDGIYKRRRWTTSTMLRLGSTELILKAGIAQLLPLQMHTLGKYIQLWLLNKVSGVVGRLPSPFTFS